MKNGKKIIEIRKAGFLNKGAQLMLLSIIDFLSKHMDMDNIDLVMAPTSSSSSAPYLSRARLGLYQKAHYWRKGFQLGVFANLIPSRFRDMYGIVLDKEVDIVIDASGFSYSDQWGKYSCLEMWNSSKRWKKNGTKIILMPQAFGPFESKFNKIAIKKIINNSSIIFARDEISYNYIEAITGKRKNLKQSNDFTNLIDGVLPENFDSTTNRFCFIPNYRMIDKSIKQKSSLYLPFMIKCLKYCFEKKLYPFILIHDIKSDYKIAKQMRDAVSPDIKIIIQEDPLKIKGIIGVSSGVIGSRYHGLISALSQGVPALSTGWSHKYEMLYKDYNFLDGILELEISDSLLRQKVDLITDNESKSKIIQELNRKSDIKKAQTLEMWRLVLEIID